MIGLPERSDDRPLLTDPSSVAYPRLRTSLSSCRRALGVAGPCSVVDESRRVREQGAHLGGGQSRQHRQPAGGEHRRQPHPNIGNEHPGGPLLAPRSRRARRARAALHRWAFCFIRSTSCRTIGRAMPLQRRLARVRRAQLVRRPRSSPYRRSSGEVGRRSRGRSASDSNR